MTNVKDMLADEIRSFQQWARDTKLESPQLHWFGALELQSAVVEGDWITFLFRDPADNARHGWRWEILPRGRWELFSAHLHEDLETSEPTEPDENGIRWWGVIEDGTIVAPWWGRR